MLSGYARDRGLDAEAAEEIAQQCLTAIVDRIKIFRRDHSFRSWLRGMVEHKVSDYLAERRRHEEGEDQLLAAATDSGPGASHVWQKHWDATHIQYLLEQLTGDFAEHTLQAFHLYVLQNYPVEQIARMLGLTPNQVYVAKSRVLQRLREEPYATVLTTLYEVNR